MSSDRRLLTKIKPNNRTKDRVEIKVKSLGVTELIAVRGVERMCTCEPVVNRCVVMACVSQVQVPKKLSIFKTFLNLCLNASYDSTMMLYI